MGIPWKSVKIVQKLRPWGENSCVFFNQESWGKTQFSLISFVSFDLFSDVVVPLKLTFVLLKISSINNKYNYRIKYNGVPFFTWFNTYWSPFIYFLYISARVKMTRTPWSSPRKSKENSKYSKLRLFEYIKNKILVFIILFVQIIRIFCNYLTCDYKISLPVLVSILNDFHILPIFQLMEKWPEHRQQEAKRRKVHRRQKTQKMFQKVSQISSIYFAPFFHKFTNKNNFLKYYFTTKVFLHKCIL